MGRDLVSSRVNRPYDCRQFFSDPAQNEPRAFCPAISHKIKNAVNVSLDTQFQAIPALSADYRSQVLDMKPIFHVNGKCGIPPRNVHLYRLCPITRAGMPPTITFSSVTSFVTTAPAATITPFAIRVPAVTTLLAPSQTSSPITMSASFRSCHIIGCPFAVPWLAAKRHTPGPIRTSLPSTILDF